MKSLLLLAALTLFSAPSFGNDSEKEDLYIPSPEEEKCYSEYEKEKIGIIQLSDCLDAIKK